MSATRTPAKAASENVTRGRSYEESLLFELSRPGRTGYQLAALDVPAVDAAATLGAEQVRDDRLDLPELSEVEVVRHFTRLSTWNAAVDLSLYPLGSCTMKYNPKVNESVARLPGFAQAHPLQGDEQHACSQEQAGDRLRHDTAHCLGAGAFGKGGALHVRGGE